MLRAALLVAVSAVITGVLGQFGTPVGSALCGGCPPGQVCYELDYDDYECQGTITTTTTTVPPPTQTDPTSPYYGRNVLLNADWATDIQAAIAATPSVSSNATLRNAWGSAGNVPAFVWLNSSVSVGRFALNLERAQAYGEVAQFVLYNIPNRNCRFTTPAGDFTFANNGQTAYQNWVDSIVSGISSFPDVTTVVIIEPNSLASVVAYNTLDCAIDYGSLYQACVTYAIRRLGTLSNVHTYIDAGHAGVISTAPLRSAMAGMLTNVYLNAGSPSNVRGLATNVANYNFLTTNSPDLVAGTNPVYDELLYIQNLSPLFQGAAPGQHFIVDQSRSGVANIRPDGWITWCNLAGAGFGPRPTTSTPSPLIDAVVWVKVGGYSDGTSDSNSPRWEPFCSLGSSFGGSPDYNVFWPTYFSNLLVQANPPFL